ncbi:hypothetical protein A2773_01830 [Candidatus Gottesmanbacteria bacterium RIFCSPHIGHO2_01_FULL_39_10]|uniref:Ferric oxidoreductase domain-containing protein n=1 Tax=Candidatus Gottesmanbacteria bacterium RIFCSPHIGHO2_01_FULL_39_10 TaxID=1798375 RepID=A0A1F5ZLF6_9BACT|nr:MAG: hypothetical protein A2773_01830 [Candidatus Gottesmanbacteria bacterium RIFCSPHIGHO2_01_FULL_39_10]
MPQIIIWRSLGVVAAVGILIFGYFVSRFSPDQRFTLFFVNKAFGETAVVFIGISFLLGPLCKIIPLLSQHLYFRRYFGLAGFGLVLVHVVFSLLQLTSRFPIKWYIDHIWGVLAAIIATVIFSVLAYTSSNAAIKRFGGHEWKTIQRLGYLALGFALLHIAVAAWPRWNMWWAGEVSMPSSLVVFAFGVIVLLARVVALVIDKTNNFTKHDNPKVSDSSHHGL